MRWPTAASPNSDGGCSMPISSRPSRPSHAERLDEQVEHLAYHALRGEVWDKAVTYCQQAGAMAYDRAAFREAVAAFEQALQALAYLPEDGDARVLAIELRLALTGALRGEHRRGRALWARPRPWPGRLTTGPDWDGYSPRWRGHSW